jgi:deoxyribodipyrimidine photolyase-related protein
MAIRNLVMILGDQLDLNSSAFDDFDPERDAVWMAEVAEESTHVWSSKVRIALFLSAMRHFEEAVRQRGFRVFYTMLDDDQNSGTLSGELSNRLKLSKPKKVIFVEPGDYRVRESLVKTLKNTPFEERPDRHFLSSLDEFRQHAKGRKQLRLEFFYRELRKRHGILMEGDEPEGGQWNFDHDNRGSFGKTGPKNVPTPKRFPPDATTQTVLKLVQRMFPDHPGNLDAFDWPVTPQDAEIALEDFITHRLRNFGEFQDAMWTAQPYLYHSRLSATMNLKLLDPRKVIAAAERAYRDGRADLASVEGFIRQILGWREYVRGIYWQFMPAYLEKNALDAHENLPGFFWTAETDLNCLHHALKQTLELGYAHHIQRLMVTGLFSLLLGVEPRQIHEWYLAVYVDAVEWVELPNTVGMSQFADGGIMASKPYAATGKYLQRMSNYCTDCVYDPAEATGERACPFTTLYWDFLMKHESILSRNQRMLMQVKNLQRLTPEKKQAIREQADRFRVSLRMVTDE